MCRCRISRLTRCGRVALASIVVVVTSAGASAAAPSPIAQGEGAGSIGVRLLDIPAAARDDPRAQLYIVDHLAPGTVIHRRIEVSNTTASTAHVLLYPAAARIENGSFLGAAGHTPNDLSTWTSIDPDAADVPARGTVTTTVTIAVPHDAAPGEKYGAVWAEMGSAPAGGDGVAVVNRVGIRLYLSVGPGGSPEANFTIDSLTAKRSADGRPMVLASVHNTGGRALDLNGTLQLLAGPGGLRAGPFPANLGVTLAIGDTEPVTIALDKRLPAGPWDAEITLRSGLVERSARASITFPDTGVSPPVKTTSTRADGGSRLLAMLVALGALMIIGLLSLIFLVIRRRRHDPDRASE